MKKNRSRLFLEPSAAGALLLPVLLLVPCALAAQEPESPPAKKPENTPAKKPEDAPAKKPEDAPVTREDYDQYVFLSKASYLPAKTKTGKQSLELTFDVSPDVPRGTKINFELEYLGAPAANVDYTLASEKRKGLTFTWELDRKLVLDEHFLRTRIYVEEQTPAVRALFAKSQKLPEKHTPFPWYYMRQPIRIGTAEELKVEKRDIYETYSSFIGRLVKTKQEFEQMMLEVKEGKKLVKGDALDVAAFTEAVVEWRKKQGELQKEVADFPVTYQSFYQKSQKAHQLLSDVGKMVSKAAVRLQKEITTQYGVADINPPAHASFNSTYRFRVDSDALNEKLDQIDELVPSPEAAPAEAAAGAEGTAAEKAESGKGDGSKGGKADGSKGDGGKGE
jgi:hypothetical protein